MRVAIIVDIRGWALDHIAQAITRYNPDPTVEIDIFYQEDLPYHAKGRTRELLWEYDVIYPFCEYQAAFIRGAGISDYITTVHMAPFDSGVPPGVIPPFDHYIANIRDAVLGARRVSVISPLLEALWAPHCHVTPVRVGVDTDIFWPEDPAMRRGKPLRVGWVGNPEKSLKRYAMVEKALAGIKGVEFDPILWTPQSGKALRTHPEMADYYRTLDVYVCMSDHEGLPTPGIEAAMCGIPMVATRVGVVSELVVDGLSGFVIDQDPNQLRSKIKWMAGHPDELVLMKQMMASQAMERLDWNKVVDPWINFILGEEAE